MSTNSQRFSVAACAIVVISFVSIEAFASPSINGSSLRGLRIGGKTTFTLTGQDLSDNPRLYAPFRFQQTQKDASATSVTFEVQVSADVPAGIYPVRAVTDSGISNPILMSVDSLPQSTWQSSVEIPVALTGNVSGQQIHHVDFNASANESITVAIEGRRLGSQVRPVLRVIDPSGKQIDWAKPSRILNGDCCLQFIAASDGQYRVELHDQLYQGPNSGFFRLKLYRGNKPNFASILGMRDVATPIGFWSDNPTGEHHIPLVYHSTATEVSEATFPKTAKLPVGVTGRLSEKQEVDSYAFNVVPGSTVRFRAWSNRFGTPLDSHLRIVDSEGKQLGEGDDHDRTLDPMAEVKIPDGVTVVRAMLSSRSGTYGDDCIYRLEASLAEQPAPVVSTDANQLTIPAGQQVVVPFQIDRKGSTLPVSIEACDGSIFHFAGGTAPPAENRCLLEIAAPEQTNAIVPLQFAATAGNQASFVQAAPVNPNVSFPSNRTVVAAVASSSPISVTWASDPIGDSYRGGRFPARVTVEKPEGSEVALSILTSQTPPDEKARDAQLIRLENVRNDGNEYVFDVFVPAGFSVNDPRTWSYAVRADLKSKDGTQTTYSAFTRLRTSTAHKGLQLALESPAEQTAVVGSQDSIVFKGTISRLPEIAQPVTVQLVGIPDNSKIKASDVTVDASQVQFSVSVDISAADAEANFDKLSLQAKYASDSPALRDVRSDGIGVKIRLTPKKNDPDNKEE
ncbi:MAG: hypothetical protein KDB27_36470 [Planctomycetales bacterium]|nr:hypothetical protein [Planctomycetales bacterium]